MIVNAYCLLHWKILILGGVKFLQYFGSIRHNLATLDTFAEIMKVMSYTGLWNGRFAWYFSVTHWIRLYVLEHNLRIHGFSLKWPCLIVKVLMTLSKFLFTLLWSIVPSLHITNVFSCVCCIIAQLKLVKYKFPN